jgi:hypothetical protein
MKFSEMIDKEQVLNRIRYLYKTTYTNMVFDSNIWDNLDSPTAAEIEVTGTSDQGKFSFPLSYQSIVEYASKATEDSDGIKPKVSIIDTIEDHLHTKLISVSVDKLGTDCFDTLKNYHPSDIFYDVSIEKSGDGILVHTVALSKDGTQIYAEVDYLYSPTDIIKILVKEAFE